MHYLVHAVRRAGGTSPKVLCVALLRGFPLAFVLSQIFHISLLRQKANQGFLLGGTSRASEEARRSLFNHNESSKSPSDLYFSCHKVRKTHPF